MLSRTQALIRLAQIFEEAGFHSTADIVDGRMWRIALDMSEITPAEDDTTDKYRRILNNEYRSRYKVKSGDSNVTSHRNEESYWVLPDGNIVLLNGQRHGDAIDGIEHKTRDENGVKLSKSQEYQTFKNRYLDSYHMVSNMLGAIRVFAEMGSRLVVTSYTVPTPQQLNTIDNIRQYWSTNSFNIEQFGHVLGVRERFTNIPEWEIAIEKYERAQKASTEAPKSSEFQNTTRHIDETNSFNEPYWKAMERHNLEQNYPGDENAPLRKMYERSAGRRFANQLEFDYDEDKTEPPIDNTEQGAKDLLWSSWINTYPLKHQSEAVRHTRGSMLEGSQSFWVMPDGSRIELGTSWHGTALNKVLRENDLEQHPGVSQMRSKHNNDYYEMMGHYYDAIRVYAYSDTLAGSSFGTPTAEQFQAVKSIIDGLGLSQFEMDQKLPDGGSDYFYSFEEWKNATQSKSKPKNSRPIDQLINNMNNNDAALWKNIERRNLEERYPGKDMEQFRRMYERSANRTASRDDYYRQALDEGHKAKFKVLEPEEPVEQFRNMHSFWLYPDGRVMDLGKQWHEDAFNDVMQAARLDEEEEFGQMYSSKDGPHEIMSDYFGMIRLFIQDKNLMVVTSYRKPTQAQIDQIQNILQQSGRGVIKIEQYGYVNGGRLVTNSMSKWINELDKYRHDAEGKSSYNTMRNEVDEANAAAAEQPYWKAREQQSLETEYPGPENEKLRKMYERSASSQLPHA